jgi:signal transduction histidine kinase
MSDVLNLPGAGSGSPDALRRWGGVWVAVEYLALSVATAVALLDRSLSWRLHALAVVLSVLYGSWYYLFVMRQERWLVRPAVVLLSFVPAIALAAALAWIHMIYTMLLFSLYGVAFGVLRPRWAVPVVLLCGALSALRLLGPSNLLNPSARSAFLGFGLSVLSFIVLGLFMAALIRQGVELRRAIEELQATRSELARAERQEGVLQERQRLAAEIHDTLAQGLASIVMHLEAAEQALMASPSTAREHMVRARSAARENLAEARRFVWALQPQALEREPFANALSRAVERWSEDSGVPATMATTGTPRPLPQAVEVALLRAAQEALANAAKHASAHRVNITLSFMQDQVNLDVQDDGVGFDPAQATAPGADARGYGLPGMRERARQLGGSVEVDSHPGEGTTVTIVMPLASPQEEVAQ